MNIRVHQIKQVWNLDLSGCLKCYHPWKKKYEFEIFAISYDLSRRHRGDVWFFFTFFKSSFKIQQNMINIKYV